MQIGRQSRRGKSRRGLEWRQMGSARTDGTRANARSVAGRGYARTDGTRANARSVAGRGYARTDGGRADARSVSYPYQRKSYHPAPPTPRQLPANSRPSVRSLRSLRRSRNSSPHRSLHPETCIHTMQLFKLFPFRSMHPTPLRALQSV